MQEMQGQEDPDPGSGRSLSEKTATHSCILPWEISWTEKPGEPQSMDPQRVGHEYDWACMHITESAGDHHCCR